MKNVRSIALLLLVCIMMGSICVMPASAVSYGLEFEADNTFNTSTKTFSLPLTLEALVRVPKSQTDRAGVIIGNYSSSDSTCVNFEIYSNGVPRVYIIDKSTPKVKYDVKFDSVHLNNDKLTHIAVTVDSAAGEWKCYVDGALKQTVKKSAPASFDQASLLRVGGDLRSGNSMYFKGTIQKIALYSDVRSAEEILSDHKGALDKNNAILVYDFSSIKTDEVPTTIKCAAGTGFDLSYKLVWVKNPPALEDYAYSFSIVGDIQSLNYHYPEKLPTLYNWIKNNAAATKMKACIGLGDITDKNQQAEYDRAKTEFKKLNGVVPYTFIRGNHDKLDMYKQNFSYSDWSQYVTGSYDNTTMLNTYYKFQVGSIKYMIISLDFALKDEHLEWADQLIASNPDHHVIVTTHIYMNSSGNYYNIDTMNGKGYGVENNGEDLWEKVLSKHENVVMMICGHNPTEKVYYKNQKGVNGNVVAEFLIDPQDMDEDYGGLGMVAMFYFSEDGKNVQIRYYSTIKDAYFLPTNQYNVLLDVPGDNSHRAGKNVTDTATTTTTAQTTTVTTPAQTTTVTTPPQTTTVTTPAQTTTATTPAQTTTVTTPAQTTTIGTAIIGGTTDAPQSQGTTVTTPSEETSGSSSSSPDSSSSAPQTTEPQNNANGTKIIVGVISVVAVSAGAVGIGAYSKKRKNKRSE